VGKKRKGAKGAKNNPRPGGDIVLGRKGPFLEPNEKQRGRGGGVCGPDHHPVERKALLSWRWTQSPSSDKTNRAMGAKQKGGVGGWGGGGVTANPSAEGKVADNSKWKAVAGPPQTVLLVWQVNRVGIGHTNTPPPTPTPPPPPPSGGGGGGGGGTPPSEGTPIYAESEAASDGPLRLLAS